MIKKNRLCIVCGGKAWRKLLKLKALPVFTGCTKDIDQTSASLSVEYCIRCGLIRKANNFISIDQDQKNGIYYPLTRLIKQKVEEDRKFYNFLKKYIPIGSSILDIGCHDGYFISLFRRKKCRLFGCEPSFYANVARKKYGISIKQDAFKASIYKGRKFDFVVLRNILCVANNPLCMIRDAVSLLKPGGCIAIENINADVFLDANSIPSFSHEIKYYFSMNHIKMLLSFLNIRLIDTNLDRRMYFVGKKDLQNNPDYKNYKHDSYIKKIYKFRDYYNKKVPTMQTMFNEYVKSWKEKGQCIALFGAGAFAQAFMALFDINEKDIDCVIDSDPFKEGCYLRGTGLKIFKPSILKKEKFDIIVVTSFYQDEIIRYLNEKGIGSRIMLLYPKIGYNQNKDKV